MSNTFFLGGEIFLGEASHPWLRACVDFYSSQKQTFSCALFANSQFLCSLAKFDLANQHVRQPVQTHTFSFSTARI